MDCENWWGGVYSCFLFCARFSLTSVVISNYREVKEEYLSQLYKLSWESVSSRVKSSREPVSPRALRLRSRLRSMNACVVSEAWLQSSLPQVMVCRHCPPKISCNTETYLGFLSAFFSASSILSSKYRNSSWASSCL